MAYTQTTASSQDDVISQICAFAVANAGFTNNGMVTYSGRNVYRISKGGIFWTFYKYSGATAGSNGVLNHIVCRMSYSISDTQDPTELNSSYAWTFMSLWGFPGPYPTLYMFTDGSAIHVCLEVTTGVFNHINFGSIAKQDTFVGGEFIASIMWEYKDYQGAVPNPYLYSTMDNSYVSLQFDGAYNSKNAAVSHSYLRNVRPSGMTSGDADFAAFSVDRHSNHAYGCSYNGVVQPLIFRSPNTATLRSILLPQYVFIRDSVNGLMQLAGNVPGIRIVNMKYLDAAEVILNDWQVFPYVAKAGDRVNYPVSGDYGVAYKRI